MRRHAINRIPHLFAAAGIALVAVVGLVVFGPTDAAAGFNVFDFSCTGSLGKIDVDVRGLGNQNVCVFASGTADTDCACVNNGGNCTSDANKNTETHTVATGVSVEPKNGRVNTTVDLSSQINLGSCTALSCPSGQTARAIINTVDLTFTLCTTNAASGSCSCNTDPDSAGFLAQDSSDACDASADTFPGKKNSCVNLFQ